MYPLSVNSVQSGGQDGGQERVSEDAWVHGIGPYLTMHVIILYLLNQQITVDLHVLHSQLCNELLHGDP